MKKKILYALLFALLALMLILPEYIAKMPYILNVFILAFYMTTMSMAWNLLGGMTGQNSIGHACFMGIGAYTSALCIVKFGMNPWLSLPIAIVVTALITALVFSQCFILRGPYFTLVTIAFAEAVRQIILNWDFAGKFRQREQLAFVQLQGQDDLLLCRVRNDDRRLRYHEVYRQLQIRLCVKDNPRR